MPQYERYRLPEHEGTRDILVCTHGTVDAACAKFGYPLYRYMRGNLSSAGLRVWRVTHFGGHVFAPTFPDMPIGHYWAYIEREQAKQIIERQGDVRPLFGHYRGWAGLDDGFFQALERLLWQEHGWDWFDYAKAAEMVSQDARDDPQWEEVCLRYMTTPEGPEHVVESRVKISHRIETEHATALDEKHSYAQYQVTQKEEYLDLALQREL